MEDQCQQILRKFRSHPALLRQPEETIQLRHLRLVLQRTNSEVFTNRAIDALCMQFLEASEKTDGATPIPLEPFIRSIFAARPSSAASPTGEDVEAVRIRKLTGELVLSLNARRVKGMDVRALRLEVQRELQAPKFDMKLIVNGRALNDVGELVEPLVPQGEALEVMLLFQDLPVLDEDISHLQQLDALKRMILCDVHEKQMEGLVIFRRLLSDNDRHPPIEEVLAAGILPRLVEFSRDVSQPGLQFEAMWALTNIASGTSEQTQAVVDQGAVPVFVSMISGLSPNDDVREQAVWALGNIAGDSPQLRDLVIASGAVVPVTNLLRQATKLSLRRNGMWTISNFCRGKPKPRFEEVSQVLPTVAQLLLCEDTEVLTDACWALSYLSDGNNRDIQAVLDAGVIGRVVELLRHESASVVTPAVRVVGNICSGDNDLTQRALDAGALQAFLPLLTHNKAGIRKEVCWSISNVAAGTQDQIRLVVGAGLLPPVVQLAGGADSRVRVEALWVLANVATEGSAESVEAAVRDGCVDAFIACFGRQCPRELALGINGINGVLRAGEKRNLETGENPYAAEIVGAHGLDWIEGVTPQEGELADHLEFIKAKLSEVGEDCVGEVHEKASDSDCN